MASKPSDSSMLDRLRRLFVRRRWVEPVDLSGHRAIVTGTSPGSLGYETARVLAEWGADVVVTTRRNTETIAAQIAAEAQANSPTAGKVTGRSMDLCDAGSVAAFANWYLDEHATDGQLDMLINNAGIHLDLLSRWKVPQVTPDGHEIQWRTNFLGTSHLTHRLLPALRQCGHERGSARVVNVVSQLHSKGYNKGLFDPSTRPYNSWEAYGLSKLGLVHMTGEIQRRFAASDGVQAYCLHPGGVYTNVAAKGLENTGLIEKVRNALGPIEAFFLLTPLEGAQTQIHCATAADAAGGLYYKNSRPAKASSEIADTDVAQRLWEQTQDWAEGAG